MLSRRKRGSGQLSILLDLSHKQRFLCKLEEPGRIIMEKPKEIQDEESFYSCNCEGYNTGLLGTAGVVKTDDQDSRWKAW